ncbi:MAG: hypothetical protein ABFS17_06320, partial [Chloroflexota bacterium]
MRKLFLAVLYCGLLFGCNPAAPPAPANETNVSPAPTPTEIPLTPTAAPVTPISKESLWLVFNPPDPADLSRYGILISNLDGSEPRQLEIPPIYEQIRLSPAGAPTGTHAAIRITNPDLEPVEQVSSATIWLISLPDGEVVKKIPLIGVQAEAWIAEQSPSDLQGLISTIIGAPYVWSPDGRYLAFSGALDGESSDLYIYDLVEDQISQLSDGSKQAVIHSWSPDSRWIIHEATMFFGPQARVIYSSWAASVEGEIVRLRYGPFNNHPIIGWLSEDTFLTYTKREHGSSDELRIVNLQSGRTEFIGDLPFFEAAFDPVTSAILLNLQPVDYASANSLPGIYLLDQETRGLDLIMPGTFANLAWQSPGRKFSALQTDNKLVLFDVQGQIPITLPYAQNGQISYSPNQHWMVISNQEQSSIYTLWGELVLDIDQPGEIIWLPDSSGFVFCSRASSTTSSIYR